jgi:hypothetical protein
MVAKGEGAGVGGVVNRAEAGVHRGEVFQAHQMEITIGRERPESDPAIARQLPPRPLGFVDRVAELRQMDSVMDRLEPGHQAVIVVTGMVGVGKSALVRHWADANRHRFPGGQLYVDYTDHRYRGDDAVHRVLAALLAHYEVTQPPIGLNERASLFRSLTADRPVLVLVDNAERSAQVRLLVPGAPGSALVVASRYRLGRPALDAARVLRLKPLDDDDTTALLLSMLDEDIRSDLTADVAERLAGICAGLPRAVRIVASLLEDPDRWPPGVLATHLADEGHRLARLAAEDCEISADLDEVVHTLDADGRRAYALLGALPAAEFSTEAIARGLEEWVEHARHILHRLCDANLATGSMDRFRLHALVRLHARGLSAAREEVDRARDRVEDWYLGAALAAGRALREEHRSRFVWPSGLTRRRDWSTPQEAARWYEDERGALLALLVAAERRNDERVLEFCHALWPLQRSRGHNDGAARVQRRAVRAAMNLGDVVEEARAWVRLAFARALSGDVVEARKALVRARGSAESAEDGEAIALVAEGELELETWLAGDGFIVAPPAPRNGDDPGAVWMSGDAEQVW